MPRSRDRERKNWRKGTRWTGQEKKKSNPWRWDVWKINFNYVRNSAVSPQLFNNQDVFAGEFRSFNSFSSAVFCTSFYLRLWILDRIWRCAYFSIVCEWPSCIEFLLTDDWIRIDRRFDRCYNKRAKFHTATKKKATKKNKNKTKYDYQPNGWLSKHFISHWNLLRKRFSLWSHSEYKPWHCSIWLADISGSLKMLNPKWWQTIIFQRRLTHSCLLIND